MYVYITDFSLQYQRSEKTGTELGKPWPCRTPMPMPQASRGRSHTKWRGRPMACTAVAVLLAPVPAPPGRALARAPSGRCMPGCTLPATAPALRCAPRRGHLGGECAATAYTPLARSLYTAVGPGRRSVHARVHPPAPRGSGGCSHGIHIPTRGGLCGAAHLGAGCRSACGLSNRPGLGVPATPSVRERERLEAGRRLRAATGRTGEPVGGLRTGSRAGWRTGRGGRSW